MSAQLIDGKQIAADMRAEMAGRIEKLEAEHNLQPGLAVIIIGADPASQVYVRNKRNACEQIGIHSLAYDLPPSTTQQELLDLIDKLNNDNQIHGILVQFPVPEHIDTETVIEAIRPDKDVDGFHPYNIGRLAVRMPVLRSCTPFGVMKLLESTGEKFYGSEALIVGASNHVGRPMALELLLAGCTVSICHRFTHSLEDWVKRSDIVVVAAGKPGLVKGEWIKPGATVIDIGINRNDDGKLVGDVDFDAACQRAAWITPVPGGVGPMTVAMLMHNTIEAAMALRGIKQ